MLSLYWPVPDPAEAEGVAKTSIAPTSSAARAPRSAPRRIRFYLTLCGSTRPDRKGGTVRQRLPIVLSAAALVVSVLGQTSLGQAAGEAVRASVPFAD